jgi:flavin-dependent dehydrogenase
MWLYVLALRMAQRGYQVVVYESVGLIYEKSDISAGRSINLALSEQRFKGSSYGWY